KHGAGVDFHGHGAGGSPPGNGVHVGAAKAYVAGAEQPAGVFGGEFERRQRSFLADVLGRDLVNSDAGADIFALGAARTRAVEPHRGGTAVIAAAIARNAARLLV